MGQPSEPKNAQRHTPVTPLYDKRGNLVGGQCDHCGGLVTPGGLISNPVRVQEPRGPGVVRFVENKAHTRRLNAAKSRVWSAIKDRVMLWKD